VRANYIIMLHLNLRANQSTRGAKEIQTLEQLLAYERF